jgi:carbonic anhydrase
MSDTFELPRSASAAVHDGDETRSRSGSHMGVPLPMPPSASAIAAHTEDESNRDAREKDLRQRATSIMVTDGNYGGAPVDYTLDNLFVNNVNWARKVSAKHPDFFHNLSLAQHPDYLWIGCSDSRVAANEIVGLVPGELFVHRNVANVVAHTDFNCLAVIQYAVDCLKVKHIIVCGHYGCGGVLAAMKGLRVGIVDNWLRHVDDVMVKHQQCLECYSHDLDVKGNKLCELNAIEQTLNVCKTTILRDAWARGQSVTVHSLIYGMSDGLIRDLNMSCTSLGEALSNYEWAVDHLPGSK